MVKKEPPRFALGAIPEFDKNPKMLLFFDKQPLPEMTVELLEHLYSGPWPGEHNRFYQLYSLDR